MNKGMRRTVSVLLLVLLLGLTNWLLGRKLEDCVTVEPVGLDTAARAVELDLTLALRKPDGDTAVAVETTIGTETERVDLSLDSDGRYTGRVSLPLGQEARVEAVITRNGRVERETLRTYEDTRSLLPVCVKRCMWDVPKYQEGLLDTLNGVLTTQIHELELSGVESGAGGVELRGYVGDTLVQTVPGEWDPESGSYSTEALEVPCKAEDTVRITVFCHDADGVAYEFTHGRWKITTGGKAEKAPELAADSYPALTWPE